MQLSQLIKSNSKYDLTIFSTESIDRIESNIFEKKNEKYFIECLKRKYGTDEKGGEKLDKHKQIIQKHDYNLKNK